jgi:Calx-beta domain-containing protein
MSVLPLVSQPHARGLRQVLTGFCSLLLVLSALPVASARPRIAHSVSQESSPAAATSANVISLASRNSAGTDSGNAASHLTAISGDGRYVVFTSKATNLVPGVTDSNGAPDVFVFDRITNTTKLVSRSSLNTTGNGASGDIVNGTIDISADGRYIVYASEASNIATTDTNGVADVFVFDRVNESTRLISCKNSDRSATGNGVSNKPVISANSRVIAFTSTASDLSATSDTNSRVDVYEFNLDNLITKLVSVNLAGNNGGNDHSSLSTPPSVSDDGRMIAFDSEASDLAANDTNGTGSFGTDVFVRDMQDSITKLVSINSAGTGNGNANSFGSAVRISGNGQFVVFCSSATNLVTGVTDSNGGPDIFIRNLVANSTSLVSVNSAGNATGGDISQFPAISNNGRYVAFGSRANDLVPMDTNNGLGVSDAFVRDTVLGVTNLVSINSAGTDSGNSSSGGTGSGPEISSDGRFVLFISNATNLTSDSDTNSGSDLFIRDLQSAATKLVTIDRFGNAAGLNSSGYSFSDDGSAAAFESQSPVLVTNDHNFAVDVFVSGPQSTGLSVSDVTVTEGDSGTTDAVFTISLSGTPASGNVTATATTFNGTALSGSDFQFVSVPLTFAPGETSKTVSVPVIGDTVFEQNETFTLELRNVSGANVINGVGTCTIVENEGQPSLSVNDITVAEGDSGTTNATFTVSLSNTSSNTVSFGFGLTNGTAVEQEDFQGVGGGSLIAAGMTSTTITVPIIGDTVTEGNETFFINLANPANATISDNQGMATIIDDESSSKPPTVQFAVARPSVSEGGKSITVEVTRSGDLSAGATVDYATTPSNASERSDYTSAFGKLRFAAGESSKTLKVFITDDVFVEGNELFLVNLSNPTGGASLGSPATSVVTITDNDSTPPNSNPADDASFFVRQHYIDFLNREPDAAGLAFWTNQITECQQPGATCDAAVRRINVSAAFFLSIEFQETGYLVERIYKSAYGDATGVSTFGGTHQLPVPIVRFNEFLPDTQQIGNGVVVGDPGSDMVLENNKVSYTQDFVSRSRFTSAYATTLTPTQFVDALFTNAGVTPAANDRTTAINEFGGAGNTVDTAARARALRRVAENSILNQQEKNRAFVLMEYFGYLRRNPNDPQDSDYTGYDFWLTKLNEFHGNFVNAEMVKSFLVSGEYRHRFGP